MQPDDRGRFQAIMAGMAKLYEREIDAPLMDAYWMALRPWLIQDFEQAAGHLMATSKFMPRPAEFNDLRKAGRLTSGEAWAAVLDHIKGGYRDGGLDPETDQAVRALGGYKALAMMDSDQLPWQERRFAEHYEQMQDVEGTRLALPQVAGLSRLNHEQGLQPIAKLLPGPPA